MNVRAVAAAYMIALSKGEHLKPSELHKAAVLRDAITLLKFEGLVKMTDDTSIIFTERGKQHTKLMGFEIYPALT